MIQQLSRRLIGYFSLTLLLFALLIGSCFSLLFTRYSQHVHEEELQRRAETLAAAIPSMEQAQALLVRSRQLAVADDANLADRPARMSGHGMMGRGHHRESGSSSSMMGNHNWCRQVYSGAAAGQPEQEDGRSAAVLSQLNQLADSPVWLVSAADHTIYSYGETTAAEVGELPSPVDAVLQQVLAGGMSVSQDFTPLVGTAAVTAGAPIRDDDGKVIGAVLLHQPLQEMQAAQWSGLRLLGISLLLALLLSGGMAIVLARRFIRPIYQMQAAARSFTQGDFTRRTEVRQHDELGMLAHDIDELGEQLGQAKVEREAMQQRRQDFLSAVSHELRTPLTVLRGTLELMLSGIVKDPERQKTYAAQTMDNLSSLERMVGDLLEFTRLQNPDFSIEMAPVDLAEAFSEAVRSAEPLAVRKNLTLSADFSVAIPLTGDYGRLRQLMLILLDNAIKFSPAGGTIRVDERMTAGHWQVVVSDEGPGISPERLPYIFDRFHTSRSAENLQGTGLGLPIAREIAGRHGLELRCESQLGEGTHFILEPRDENAEKGR